MTDNRIEQVKNLVLIEPILHPLDYLRKSLRGKLIKELCTEGEILSKRNDLFVQLEENISVDFDGHELSASFYKDLCSIQEHYNSEALVEHIKNGYMISISLTGKISKDSQEVIRVNPHLPYKELKMELFWNKVDEVANDELINEVVGYCLSNYN